MAADAQGNLHVTWLRSDWTVATKPHPQIMYRRRGPDGVWSPAEVASETDVQTNENSDQGPSIVVTQNGEPHIAYVSALPVSAVRTVHRSAGTWVTNHPPVDVFTHAPQVYSQFNDVYVFSATTGRSTSATSSGWAVSRGCRTTGSTAAGTTTGPDRLAGTRSTRRTPT